MIALMLKHRGNKSKIADELGVDRHTVARTIEDDPSIAAGFAAALDRRVDTVEDSLYILAAGIPKIEQVMLADGSIEDQQTGWLVPPDARAIKILLDAKARDRGYGKQELVLSNDEPLQVMIVQKVIKRADIEEGNGYVVE